MDKKAMQISHADKPCGRKETLPPLMDGKYFYNKQMKQKKKKHSTYL